MNKKKISLTLVALAGLTLVGCGNTDKTVSEGNNSQDKRCEDDPSSNNMKTINDSFHIIRWGRNRFY